MPPRARSYRGSPQPTRHRRGVARRRGVRSPKVFCLRDQFFAHVDIPITRTRAHLEMGGKKKGPTTVDALGNTVSVAELRARAADEEARAAAKARREAKAAANADASSSASAGTTRGDGDGGGGDAPVFASLEDQLRAMMIKRNDGAKLTGKERKMLAKAEKEGRLPSLEPPEDGGASRKGPPALSAPESWARALEAVSVHVRGGGGNDDDFNDANATDAVVDVSGMDVSVRGVRLFEDASFKIARGQKLALLGANGSGKSTLVRLIASGRIRARVHDVACVAQELESGERSALDALVSCDARVEELLREESALIDAMEAAENASDNAWDDAKWREASGRLGELAEELERRDAYASEAKARRILAGLGFSDEQMSGPLSKLSGGWRMRAALAQALFVKPGLLLLDEPTNHLDLPATTWLASYLSGPECAKTSVLVVSHSADFVSSAKCGVLHLDHFAKKNNAAHRWTGGHTQALVGVVQTVQHTLVENRAVARDQGITGVAQEIIHIPQTCRQPTRGVSVTAGKQQLRITSEQPLAGFANDLRGLAVDQLNGLDAKGGFAQIGLNAVDGIAIEIATELVVTTDQPGDGVAHAWPDRFSRETNTVETVKTLSMAGLLPS